MRHKPNHGLLFRGVGGQKGSHIAVSVFRDLLHADIFQLFHHHIGKIEQSLRARIGFRLRIRRGRVGDILAKTLQQKVFHISNILIIKLLNKKNAQFGSRGKSTFFLRIF